MGGAGVDGAGKVVSRASKIVAEEGAKDYICGERGTDVEGRNRTGYPDNQKHCLD